MEPDQSESVIPDGDPLALVRRVVREALGCEPNDANAMALAPRPRWTAVGADGAAQGPRAEGFVFYTNALSRKGAEIAATAPPRCCSTGSRCAAGADRRRAQRGRRRRGRPPISPTARAIRSSARSPRTSRLRSTRGAPSSTAFLPPRPSSPGAMSAVRRLDRVPPRPRHHRILARPPAPPPRAPPLYPHRRGWASTLLYP